MGGKRMTDIFLFYWFAWFFVIIVYFFMAPSVYRTYLLVWLLLMIIFRAYHVEIFSSFPISLTYMVLVCGAFCFMAFFSFSFTEYMYTFILVIGFMALLIWEKVTPVWFFISANVMIALIISLLSSYFIKQLRKQVASVLFSMSIGYTLFHLMLIGYDWDISQMEAPFFPMLATTIVFLFCIFFLKQITTFVKQRI